MFVWAVKPHTDSTSLVSPNWRSLSTSAQLLPFTSTSLSVSLSHPPSLFIISLSVRLSVSPFFPGPLVRLMDDSAGREWQYINYLAASLILIWLLGSSGSAEGRLGHILTWPGSTTNKIKELNVKTAPASICTCFLHVHHMKFYNKVREQRPCLELISFPHKTFYSTLYPFTPSDSVFTFLPPNPFFLFFFSTCLSL